MVVRVFYQIYETIEAVLAVMTASLATPEHLQRCDAKSNFDDSQDVSVNARVRSTEYLSGHLANVKTSCHRTCITEAS